MTVAFRSSTDADLDWIAELRAVVLREDLERLGRFDPVRVRQRLRDGFDAANTRIIVFNGSDIGSVTVRRTPDARWLEHFYICPAMQGQGVGSRVLKLVLTEPDTAPLRLNVLRGSGARSLYERHGFEMDTEDDVDIFMNYRDVDTVHHRRLRAGRWRVPAGAGRPPDPYLAAMNRKQPGREHPDRQKPDSEHSDMEQWWTQLDASTQAWLAEHNGEAVPASIQQEIIRAGGSLGPDAWWTGSSGPSGFHFSDAGVDWIEAAANGELPPAP